MADVFISYSQTDKAQARLLAALLEANGYTVWWDTNLEVADDFSEEILKQLTLAKVIVVIWSETSVKSKWVRAEAIIADRDEKILPLKLRGLPHDAIRPPFNVLHTESVDDERVVLEAVRKQAMKPASTKVRFRAAYRELLLFAGVVGATITVFTNLDGILKMANWVHWLRLYWDHYLGNAFVYVASLVGWQFPREITREVSLISFLFATAIGTRLRYGNNYSQFKLSSRRFVVALFVPLVLIALMVAIAISEGKNGNSALIFMLIAIVFYPTLLASTFLRYDKFWRTITSLSIVAVTGISSWFIFLRTNPQPHPYEDLSGSLILFIMFLSLPLVLVVAPLARKRCPAPTYRVVAGGGLMPSHERSI